MGVLAAIIAISSAALAPDPPATARSDRPVSYDAGDQLAAGLEGHAHWALRAIACMRLESSPDAGASGLLKDLMRDPDPRVRAFAVCSLVLRGEPPPPDVLLSDGDRRVLRAALRAGAELDPASIAAVAEPLLRSDSAESALTGVELAVFTDDPKLRDRVMERLGRIILRLDHAEAGGLAVRLEQLAGGRPGVRPRDWQRWWQSASPRTRTIARTRIERGHSIDRIDAGAFHEFALALRSLVERPIDLAFCIDSTASMSRSLAAAQRVADAASRLVIDLVPGSRIGVVAYRDRRSDFIVRHWPLTSRTEAWRSALWTLVADKGGSEPEAVDQGLRAAYESLDWRLGRRSVLLLIGDGPPHVGTRGHCVAMAAAARERMGVVTFTISADDDRDPKGFAEIASAGGGQALKLSQEAEAPALILNGAFGDDWARLIRVFLERADLLIR